MRPPSRKPWNCSDAAARGHGGRHEHYAVSGFFAIAVDEHMPAGRPELPR
jgi:hypothetical protein